MIPLFLALISAADADVKIRVIHGSNKTNTLDPKINDLFGLLKSLNYTGYELKESTDLQLVFAGPVVVHALPSKRHLNVSAKAASPKKGKAQVQIELEIPELKFKTKATVMAGATLVIGGPKFEDGVLFFAVTATALSPASQPAKQ